ncbi:hypothetical protein AAOE16_18295 [Ekhidna sp. MALMAid0563]|uniref:hypothetical protein n=1 Tax=Ekhidna sp. MALMAid0563 TaxID=3143937 RepID=UPI0032DFFD18
MSHLTITLPEISDLESFKALGHIVFKMEQLGSDEKIKEALLTHLKNSVKKSGDPVKEKKGKLSLADLDEHAEI